SPKPDTSLQVSPAVGASGVSPATPVSVTLPHGTLTAVSLVGSDGQAIAGALSADQTSWHNTRTLLYNRTYTLKMTGLAPAGTHVDQSSASTTLRRRNLPRPGFSANEGMSLDGGTFGVGQPIVLRFDEPIPDKAAAERALSVSPAIDGGWYWMSNYEVHWRPR